MTTKHNRSIKREAIKKPLILEIKTIACDNRDWVIGATKQDIIDWACSEYGCEESDLTLKEIPESEWEQNKILSLDSRWDEDEGDWVYDVMGDFAQTAKEWKAGVEVIATEIY